MVQDELMKKSMILGEMTWEIVGKWDYFQRDTVGKQLVRSADSVAANLSEGAGRFSFKERAVFYLYARGSLLETKTWFEKAKNRRLVTPDDHKTISELITSLHLKMNLVIKNTRNQL